MLEIGQKNYKKATCKTTRRKEPKNPVNMRLSRLADFENDMQTTRTASRTNIDYIIYVIQGLKKGRRKENI